MRITRGVLGLAAVALTALAPSAWAQWSSQTITLNPGWNAVFLEVEPADSNCDAVFADLPVRSVWGWVKEFSAAQFVRDPNKLTPDLPDWLVYFPQAHPQRFLRTLHTLIGGRTYLVELDSAAPVTWTLVGPAVARAPDWVPNSFNLVGFHLDPAKPVSMQDFFAPSPSLAGQEAFRITASGDSEPIANPKGFMMRPGEAYWIYCKGDTNYAGPFALETRDRGAIVFGKGQQEQPLRLINHSNVERTITVRPLPSARPDKSGVAGVALSFQRLLAWHPLEDTLSFKIAPNSVGALPLSVRRAAMPPVPGEDTHESLLEIKDNAGMRFVVPVKALKAAEPTGLWVGNVRLNAVSEAGNPNDFTTPTAAASEFEFRIIVHVDAAGNARLLQDVALMYAPETPAKPERNVLITRTDLIPEYQGGSVRSGTAVGRRISAPAFGFRDPVALAGNLDTQLTGTVSMGYNDPLNPFVHRFNPDHDNLDERYQTTLAAGSESFNFSRALTLQFTAQDPEELGLPEWGDELIGGVYRETITGVHLRPITVQGTFLLNKVTDVDVLNDGR